MPEMVSFDIVFLGLDDPSKTGRAKLSAALQQLTEDPPVGHDDLAQLQLKPLFEAISRDRAREIAEVLENNGVRIEIRPVVGRPPVGDEDLIQTQRCPRCGFVQPAGLEDCRGCGLVFAKWDREQVQKMQRERGLEETVRQSQEVRDKWRGRAEQYLNKNPLPPGATEPFADQIKDSEIPFAAMGSDRGPILMTSTRMLLRLDDADLSLPYEMIADVDTGGFVIKKEQLRLAFKLHGNVRLGSSETDRIVIKVEKTSESLGDLIMDWAFARSFACGQCGEADLDYRLDSDGVHARCMHCASDHLIDMTEGMAVPVSGD